MRKGKNGKCIWKNAAALLMAAVLLFGLSACGGNRQRTDVSVSGLPIIHEPEFGGVYITITIDDFNARGFRYGDSVDLSFSNGYTLNDLPYYNGYYVDAGEVLVIAYPGYAYVKAAVNYGADLWETAGVDKTDTASVRLNTPGKYREIQEARDIHYFDERERYTTDEIFANFRAVSVTGLGKNVFYRSASPCDNQHNRAPYVDRLMKDAGVNCILNLADNEEKIEGYIQKEDFDSPYFLTLYEGGQVIPLALSMNYLSDDFGKKIAASFTEMAEKEGPYLVHCTEGKDRTGFVCMLVEALMGASYQEIVDDYMLTYDNYYKINQKSDKAKYDVILDKNLVSMMKTVVGDDQADLKKTDLAAAAKAYLIRSGMTEDAVERLKEKLK